MIDYFKGKSFKIGMFSAIVALVGSKITCKMIGIETQALFEIFSGSFILSNFLIQFALIVLYCTFACIVANKIFAE